jgi:hypothetical protein
MGSIFGSTTNPTPSSPIVGGETQTAFFNSLFGLGLTNNPADGTKMFNSMPSYQGQLTPDLNNMMASNVWNGWQQQSPGMSNLNQTMQGIQGGYGQASPWTQSIMYGGAGPAGQAMNNLISSGSAGAGGDYLTNLANGRGPAMSMLNPYMQPQQVSSPLWSQAMGQPFYGNQSQQQLMQQKPMNPGRQR